MIDRDCESFETTHVAYASLVQSIRLVSCDRRNVWAPSTRRFSTAAIGVDFLGDEIVDFRDGAAILANMDLAITIDTSLAHLAGAMGKPVWVLLADVPDWRWMLEGRDTPWYPTATLFRQRQPGDWAGVLAEVRRALENFSVPRTGSG